MIIFFLFALNYSMGKKVALALMQGFRAIEHPNV